MERHGDATRRLTDRPISWDTSIEPYQADNRVDLNGNGVVCAKPSNKTFTDDGVTYIISNFIDHVLR